LNLDHPGGMKPNFDDLYKLLEITIERPRHPHPLPLRPAAPPEMKGRGAGRNNPTLNEKEGERAVGRDERWGESLVKTVVLL